MSLTRSEKFIFGTATVVSVLAVLLVLAAWRDDHKISGDQGVATAEVLSAGALRSAIFFVTPDGATHNPKLGVLYPTHLTVGQRIEVEYSRADPDLVRVSNRDARVAIIPVTSVIVTSWAAAFVVVAVLRRTRARRSSELRPDDTSAQQSRIPESAH